MSRLRLPRLDRLTAGQSLQTRFGFLTAFIVAGAVLGVSLIAVAFSQYSLRSQIDEELINVAAYAAEPISNDVEGMGGLNTAALSAANVTMLLLRSDGTIIRVPDARPTIDPGSQERMIARIQMGASTRTAYSTTNEQLYRVVAVPLMIDNARYALVLGRPFEPILATLSSLGTVMAATSLIFVVLGAWLGWRSGRSVVQPLRELSDAVTHVTETDELVPIGIHADNELGELSRSFDTMMHSLESSRDRQRRLIADAGHELRTPLTSMRTNVELLVADEKTGMLPDGARAEILTDVAAQLGEFTSLVGDLVQLARDDVVSPSPEPLDFADVVGSAVVRAQRRGPNLTFDVHTQPYYVIGEPDTLERAVTNLLDNAVKFSPEGGTIHVDLTGDVLTIGDEGPGIAEEDLPRIFDRFYRSNKARNTPGTGLGLSIVAHTVNAHGGWVKAGHREGGGAEFKLRLPPAPAEALAEMDRDLP